MEEMNIPPGDFLMRACQSINVERKTMSAYKMSQTQRKRRKVLRHNKKKKQVKHIDLEGPSYEAGGF